MVGGKYCADCCCVVDGCYRPRFQSDYCKAHRRTHEEFVWPWALVAAMGEAADAMIPCDVKNFCERYLEVRGDWVMVILLARLKEPTAVAVLLESHAMHRANNGDVPYDANHLREWLTKLAVELDGAPHAHELKQLQEGGVGRFMGSQMTLQELGIVVPADTGDEKVLLLGLGRTCYRAAEPPPPGQENGLQMFYDECRRHQWFDKAPTDEASLGRIARHTSDVLSAIADNVRVPLPPSRAALKVKRAEMLKGKMATKKQQTAKPKRKALAAPKAAPKRKALVAPRPKAKGATKRRRTAPTISKPLMGMRDPENYNHVFVVRKILIGEVAIQGSGMSWGTLDANTLLQWCPDRNDHMKTLPKKPLRELSCLLVGRPDYGILLSMYACLWNDVEDMGTQEKLLEILAAADLRKEIRGYHQEHKVPPTLAACWNS